MNALHLLLLASQIADATTSGRVLSNGYELNPLMKPFSHGGAATMLAGEVLIDTTQESATKRWSVGQRNNVTMLFIVEHLVFAVHNANQLQREPLQVAVPLGKF